MFRCWRQQQKSRAELHRAGVLVSACALSQVVRSVEVGFVTSSQCHRAFPDAYDDTEETPAWSSVLCGLLASLLRPCHRVARGRRSQIRVCGSYVLECGT